MTRQARRLGVALGTLLLATVVVGQARAASDPVPLTPAQERRAASLYEELKCPVCKTQSLGASTSFMSEEMKAQIREQVKSGMDDQEILDFYVARYGEWILMRPPARGRGLWAWVLPALALLGGTAGAFVALRRWARRGEALAQQEPPAPTVSDADRERIDALTGEGGRRES